MRPKERSDNRRQENVKMKKFLDVWTKVLWYITAVMVLATIVVITMQIVWRYVLNDPLSWT